MSKMTYLENPAMQTEVLNLIEDWPRVSMALSQSRIPWPDSAIRVDWAWYQGQVARGERRAMPGRHSLARRWRWGENRVRRFLQLHAVPSEDGVFALPSRRMAPSAARPAPAGSGEAVGVKGKGHPALTRPSPASSLGSARFSSSPNDAPSGGHQPSPTAPSSHPVATLPAPGPNVVTMRNPIEDAIGSTTRSPGSRHLPTRVPGTAIDERVKSEAVAQSSVSVRATTAGNEKITAPSLNAGKNSDLAAHVQIPGTEVEFLPSSYPSRSLPLSRERSPEERMREITDSAPIPPLQEMLRIARRWSGAAAPKGRQWRLDPLEDSRWFLLEIMPMPEAAALDLVEALKDWDNYLERIARSPRSPDIKLFPKNWKSALRKQIQLKADYLARQGKEHGDEGGGKRSLERSGAAQSHLRPDPSGQGSKSAGRHCGHAGSASSRSEIPQAGTGGSGGGAGEGTANGAGARADSGAGAALRPGRESWYWGTWKDGTPFPYPLEHRGSSIIPQEWLDENPGFLDRLWAGEIG